jgi:hypothetical protein
VATAQNAEQLQMAFANSTNSGTYSVNMDDAWWEVPAERLVWRLTGGPLPILDDNTGALVATLVRCEIAVQFSPTARVELNAGVLATDEMVNVTLQSPVLNFPTIAAADAYGRASVSLDLMDDTDGFAEVTSLATPVGTGLFRARYNGVGELGATFAHLIWQVSILGEPGASAGSINVSQASPNFGYAAIGADVSSMSVDISYAVTPGDFVLAISSFELDRSVEGWSCPGDLDRDGVVNLGDIAIMLTAYGECDSDSPADMNGDRCVNVTDLGMLLAVFGAGC